MFASVLSAAILGMDVHPIQVEADVSDGLPTFTMVGFPSAQVKEAQDRVRTALKNNGIALPPKRITVNFAPADIKKEGAGFDLPLAAAVLAASDILKSEQLDRVMMAGEISLNGEIHAISGILPIIIRAREEKCRFCVVPYENLREATLIPDMKVIGVRNLQEMIRYVQSP
ncbi:MAG: magnesium chelatase domain-containing protein [Blautia sp.]